MAITSPVTLEKICDELELTGANRTFAVAVENEQSNSFFVDKDISSMSAWLDFSAAERYAFNMSVIYSTWDAYDDKDNLTIIFIINGNTTLEVAGSELLTAGQEFTFTSQVMNVLPMSVIVKFVSQGTVSFPYTLLFPYDSYANTTGTVTAGETTTLTLEYTINTPSCMLYLGV